MSWNEPEILRARQLILGAAQDMLAGRLTYIEGARKIVAAGWSARLDERDLDWLPFIGIASETEALPLGAMRAHWQQAALDALQPEIDRMETSHGDLGSPVRRTPLPRSRGAVFQFLTGRLTRAAIQSKGWAKTA